MALCSPWIAFKRNVAILSRKARCWPSVEGLLQAHVASNDAPGMESGFVLAFVLSTWRIFGIVSLASVCGVVRSRGGRHTGWPPCSHLTQQSNQPQNKRTHCKTSTLHASCILDLFAPRLCSPQPPVAKWQCGNCMLPRCSARRRRLKPFQSDVRSKER